MLQSGSKETGVVQKRLEPKHLTADLDLVPLGVRVSVILIALSFPNSYCPKLNNVLWLTINGLWSLHYANNDRFYLFCLFPSLTGMITKRGNQARKERLLSGIPLFSKTITSPTSLLLTTKYYLGGKKLTD